MSKSMKHSAIQKEDTSVLAQTPDKLMKELILGLDKQDSQRGTAPQTQQDVSPTVQALMDKYGMSRDKAERGRKQRSCVLLSK